MIDQNAYADVADQGTGVLVSAFGAVIQELFKKPVIISVDNKNPFAELPEHIQMSIIQNAFYHGLGQSLAAMFLIAEGIDKGDGTKVTEKDILALGATVLRHHFQQHLAGFRRDQKNADAKNNVGKGPDSGHAGSGPILDPGNEARDSK